jgi:hypothetical protein
MLIGEDTQVLRLFQTIRRPTFHFARLVLTRDYNGLPRFT